MPKKFKSYLPLIFFIAAFFTINNWWRIDLYINPLTHTHISQQDVVMYSTSWCPYCQKARRFFQQAGIPFVEYDIEESSQALQEYERLGGRGVPVIQIGRETIRGYDAKAIREAIEALNINIDNTKQPQKKP